MENFSLSERYKRNVMLPEIGCEGQRRLAESRVLVVGAGGLGSPVILYLAAAGVGNLTIVDFDRVDLSNLQRQIIHTTTDLGRLKTESACGKVQRLNPDIRVTAACCRFDSRNAPALVADHDIVVDATDSLRAKYLVNDTCVHAGIPFVHGAISRFTGNVFTYVPDAPCLRCLFPEAVQQRESSADGILGAVAGIAGCIQAAETIKCLIQAGDMLTGRLLTFDALSMQFHTVDFDRLPECPCCGRPSDAVRG